MQKESYQIQKNTKITYNQLKVRNTLRNNEKFITFVGEKGHGLVIIERDKYIRQTLSEKLLKSDTYRTLEPGELEFIMDAAKKKLVNLLTKAEHEKLLKEHDINYFRRALQHCNITPQFYCNYKIHKKPWKLRPVTGTGGSLLASISK